jgi:hypothetical protein
VNPEAALCHGGLSAGRGRLDALVLSGRRLDHYRRSLARPDRPWERVGTVSVTATGPGRLVRSRRRLYALVPEEAASLVYRLDPSGWTALAGAVPPPAALPPAPSAAELGVDEERLRSVAAVATGGRRLALADEDGSVFGYQRLRDGTWERESCLRLADPEPFARADPESVKLAQVTGSPAAPRRSGAAAVPTLSDSLADAGIRGTDLGVRVEHAGRSFLLFGDTHWTRPWLATRDAIAEVVDPDQDRPGVRFHGSPLKLVGRAAGRVTMREYDVPLDGFSHGGRLYGLFTSNHFRGHRVMGRSLIARAVDAEPGVDPAQRRRPLRFEVLGVFSDRHFINASVQVVPASAVAGCGLSGDLLLSWGTGPYRASEVRLAVRALDDGWPFPVRYWTGAGWSESERDARGLFTPAAIGELSVRWVPAAGRYLMLSASAPEDPIGAAVVLRSAPSPWGPWSARLRLLDWVTTGMSTDPHTRFIRASTEDEEVGDRMFRGQAGGAGAAYAPYLFDARADGAELVLRYTLSTWNPYQVVLMAHRLPLSMLG